MLISHLLSVSSCLYAVCLKPEPKGATCATGSGGRPVAPTLFPPERPAQRHGLTMYRFGVVSKGSGPQALCLSARNRMGSPLKRLRDPKHGRCVHWHVKYSLNNDCKQSQIACAQHLSLQIWNMEDST